MFPAHRLTCMTYSPEGQPENRF